MPGVNLDNIRAAQVQPTVGTESRMPLTRPDYGGVLGAVVGAAQKIKQAGTDKAEQQAALAIVDESLTHQEGKTSFEAGKPEDQGEIRATAVEEETGITLDAEDKKSLTSAAQVGLRLNEAQTALPSGETRFNLIRTRELRKLIASRPHLAKEFRSLIYGDNNFITAAMEGTEHQAAAEAKARHESISKVRDMMVLAGNPEYADMSDNQVIDNYAKSGYAADVKRLADGQREANTYKAMYEKGQAINSENTRRMVLTVKPGVMRTTMTRLDAIQSNPTMDPATKARAIDADTLAVRMKIQDEMPWLSATEIQTQFKDVLEDVPNTYKMLASEGPEKAAAEQRLSIVKNTIELDLERRYGKSTVEFTSRVVNDLSASGVLTNYDLIRDSLPVKNFMTALAAVENNDNTSADIRVTPRTEREIAEESSQNNVFIRRMLGGFDKLDENSRRATAVMVLNGIRHPDNLRSPAGMDRMIALMASPEFKTLAESPEWQDSVDAVTDRAIGNYLKDLDLAVGTTLGPMEGKVDVKLDQQGVLTFVPQPGLRPADRDKLARLQNRLRNAIFANANLNGQTPAEATRDFYEAYLKD